MSINKIVLILLLIPIFTIGQEVCNNGIDDDGDGLIDLNDVTNCSCYSYSTSIQSLIQNPSFENNNCCPTGISQYSCVTNWINTNSNICMFNTDYFNTCGYTATVIAAANLLPFPDGNACVGIASKPGWSESISTCLNLPLMTGNSYTLKFNVASFLIDSDVNSWTNLNNTYGTFDFSIYGVANCSSLPINGTGPSCPMGPPYGPPNFDNWVVLGSISYNPSMVWQTATVTFTPTINIDAITIGSSCDYPLTYNTIPSQCFPYYLLDNFILNESALFNSTSVNINNDNACGSSTGTVTVSNLGSNIYTIAEGTNTITTTASNSFVISNVSVGTHTYIITANGGCVSTYTANVTGGSIPNLSSISSVNLGCNPSTAILTATSSVSSLSYTWQGTGIVSGANTANATVSQTGNYTVTVSDGVCNNYSVVTVNTNTAIPNVSVTQPATITCTTPSVILNGNSTTSGVTYSWIPVGVTTNTAIANNAGNYTITVTDTQGCKNYTVVTVSHEPSFTINTTVNSATCAIANGSANISIQGGINPITYNWSNGNATANLQNVSAGNYTLTVTDASGCIKIVTTTVGQDNGNVFANAGTNYTIAFGTNTQLQGAASANTTYTWLPSTTLSCTDCLSPTASPTITTIYTLTATDANGCKATGTIEVFVKGDCNDANAINLPNAFSPNGDGANDIFCIQDGQSCINNMTLIIYDRWGEKVFETNNPAFCWDGTYKGKLLDPAVFVYFAKVSFTNGQTAERKGNVTLIK